MKKCAVVISVWKENISECEALAISQCLKVLKDHPIVFVSPMHLNLDAYKSLCDQNNNDFYVERFDDGFFEDILAYNHLLLNIEFYKRFEKYEYILLYQPDAWVFKDDLQAWIDKGYDYIGAPWFEGWANPKPDACLLPYAGNGGFSLRNVQKIIKILSFPISICYVRKWKDVFEDFKKNRLISNILSIPYFIWKRYGSCNLAHNFFKETKLYEDRVFAKYVSKFYKKFRVAPPSEAMYFSFEVAPSSLYEMTKHTLPFGCHGWEKYEPEFWSQFINMNDNIKVKN